MTQSTKHQKIEHKLSQLERQFKNIEDFCSKDSETAVMIGKTIINDIKDIIASAREAYYFSKNDRYMFAVSDINLNVNISDNIKIYPTLMHMIDSVSKSRNIHPEALIPNIIRIELNDSGELLVNKNIYEFEGAGSLIDSILGL